MNPFDSIIRLLAPEAALRRARARAQLRVVDLHERSYDAAKIGRKTAGWQTSNASANNEVSAGWERSVARSRDLVRNNPYARKAVSSMVRHLVRTGIKAKWDNEAVQKKWNLWIDEADALAQLDFYSLQGQIAQTWKESGECLIRFIYEPSSRGLTVPLTLKVLEPDFLDRRKLGPAANGNYYLLGKEFEPSGRLAAYWLYRQHPGETVQWSTNTLVSDRVPASEVIHLYKVERPGQVRGMPQLGASIMRLRDQDDWQEAVLVKKKIESCYVAFIFGRDGETLGEQQPANADQPAGTKGSSQLEVMRPGMVKYLSEGTDIKFGNPPIGSDSAYNSDVLHAVAAGADITYEQLTGDLSQVNYSSLRAGVVEFRALIEMEQWLTFIPLVMKPITREWKRIGYISGALRPAPDTHGVRFTPPKIDQVDPLKETLAFKEQLMAGMMSLSEYFRLSGYDPEEVFAEIAEERKKLAALGITVDVIIDAMKAATNPVDVALADEAAGKAKSSKRLIEALVNSVT